MPDDDTSKELTLELSGQTLRLKPHPTDVTVVGESGALGRRAAVEQRRIGAAVTRLSGKDSRERDDMLAAARRDSVAQVVYQVEGTGEEILAGDRLELVMNNDDSAALDSIVREHHLVTEGRMGEAHVVRLTPRTGLGVVELAARLQQRSDVRECRPQLLLDQSPTPGLPPMPR